MSAFVLAALLSSSASAMSCWSIQGWTGSTSYPVATLSQVTCQATNYNSAWMEAVDLGVSLPEDIWLMVDLNDSHVTASKQEFYSLPGYQGESSGVPIIQLDIIPGGTAWNLVPLTTDPPDPCGANVTWWDGTQINPWYDSANCYVEPVPSGETGFIYNNSYYITPDTTPLCTIGSYDGANCYIGALPSGSTPYVSGDSLFVTTQTGGGCGIGFPYSGACYIGEIGPWANDFVWSGGLYVTPLPTCNDGDYDGANCYMGSAPSGTSAFLYGGSFYYAP